MSSKKRPFVELAQTSATPKRYELPPSHFSRTTPWRTATKPRSARSIRHVDARIAQPPSARGILSRLAKITAPTTKRRTLTPTNVSIQKENHVPIDEDIADDTKLKWPKLNFEIEESIEEDDSELPVAPTPSALLDDASSSDDDQATITFHNVHRERMEAEISENLGSLLPHSEPGFPATEEEMGGDYEATFLTERGRRAVSEEATKMSRYSFGSIHMSGFGSELEVRRASTRFDKPFAATTAEDKMSGINTISGHDNLDLGGETEVLRNLRDLSPSNDGEVAQSFHHAHEDKDTFQLDIPDMVQEDVTAHHRIKQGGDVLNKAPVLGDDNNLTDEEHAQNLIADNDEEQIANQSTEMKSRSKPRKKMKMNKRGNLVPSLPSSLIKRIVHESCRISKKRKISLGKEHMLALEQATEWYFEQISEDLEAYASHGKRKKRIDESDVLLLMRRQRLLQHDGELRQMAKQWLPPEDFEQLHLPDRP